jgi:selenocysteine-specific elongation factor
MIITLAGHVDHGKTSLVQALTGVDTDRLSEEKRRGLTIDLGFAYDTSAGETLGFVDVPGHARFIHNMVAGVASMQFALMVIAADDGPMPQSVEHLQILSLTGLKKGVIALTKCDRVSPERLAQAEQEIESFVQGTFLEGAPIYRTSAETGEGVDELKEHLQIEHLLTEVTSPERQFRLAIDRAFSVRGSGVVVTGTVHAGSVNRDDEVYLFPSGQRVRIRGLHTQNNPSDHASTGDRGAVNIAGVELDRIERGQWLCSTAHPGQRRLIVNLQVLADFPRNVGHWMPVHVYHATTHTTARIVLLGAPITPGGRADVELVCTSPLLAGRGDQVVIRDQGLEVTLGGGEVVQNDPDAARRRTDPKRLQTTKAYSESAPAQSLNALLAFTSVDLNAFSQNWFLTPTELDNLLADLNVRHSGTSIVSDATWKTWQESVLQSIKEHLEANPNVSGVKVNEVDTHVPTGFVPEVLSDLLGDKKLILTAGAYRLPGHEAELPDNLKSLLDRLTPEIDQLQAPSLGDLSKQFNLPLKSLEGQMKLLANKGYLVQVSPKRFYLKHNLAALADKAENLSTSAPFSVKDFRDQTGVGRNIAVEVLEYFDSKGFTRRTEDTRKVVGQINLT